MRYDFKPGERISIKGSYASLWFVGQVGNTVYATHSEPGLAINAEAYTDRQWERYAPFFEEGKTYRHTTTGNRVTVQQVSKLGKHRFAAGLSTFGNLHLFEENDVIYWAEE